MKRISEKKGTNEGGFYETEGKKVYVKFYADENQAYGECFANYIYNLTGFAAPLSEIQIVEGKTALVSPFVEGVQLGNPYDYSHRFLMGFAVDVFLANYDVLGLVYDNVLLNAEGDLIRIDNGSAFLHRAQGQLKPDEAIYGLPELKTFFERGTYSKVLNDCGYTNWKQLDTSKFNEILANRGTILDALKNFPLWDSAKVKKMLESRFRAIEIICG
jgi:hypothetical protein